MLNEFPLVSIGLPIFGRKYLSEAIESVLSQDFGDLELIVSDNDSQDDAAEIVSSYKDVRIRYFRNDTNIGPEGNWNRCLAFARGKYFKLLPQDDEICPNMLSRQVRILEEDDAGRVALVFGQRNIIDATGRVVMQRGCPGAQLGVIPGGDLVRRCIRYGTNVIGEPAGVLLRTEYARHVGNFDASIPYVVDLDFWVRVLAKGDAYYVPEPLACFRVSSGSWSVDIGSRQYHQFSLFIDKLAGRPDLMIGLGDIVVGKGMAFANNWLRRVFYKFALPL